MTPFADVLTWFGAFYASGLAIMTIVLITAPKKGD